MKTALFFGMALALGTDLGPAAQLEKRTLDAFEQYIRKAEARIAERVNNGDFLWADDSPSRIQQLKAGRVVIAPLVGKGDMEVPDGLVHDWMGAIFVPGATLQQVLTSVQDYDRVKYTHKPEVIDSKLIRRDGNDYKIFLKLRKKKVITVVLNTEHDVRYFPMNGQRAHSRSYSTKIAELADAGEPGERELPPGRDHGFLWRLYSYWRFEEKDGGVYMECQAISLTRDVPTGLGWLISPIVRNLPRESLESSLTSTRNAVKTRQLEAARARGGKR